MVYVGCVLCVVFCVVSCFFYTTCYNNSVVVLLARAASTLSARQTDLQNHKICFCFYHHDQAPPPRLKQENGYHKGNNDPGTMT